MTARASGTLLGASPRCLFLVRPQVFLPPNAGRETSRGILGLSTNLPEPVDPFTVFAIGGSGVHSGQGRRPVVGARWNFPPARRRDLDHLKRGSDRFDFRNRDLEPPATPIPQGTCTRVRSIDGPRGPTPGWRRSLRRRCCRRAAPRGAASEKAYSPIRS
jgi:hypothetical protein